VNIVQAVTRAIEEGDDSCWFMYVRGGCAHSLHVTFRQAPDGWDHDIFRRLARDGESTHGALTHVERLDGSLKPWLLIKTDEYSGAERRLGQRLGAEFRRDHVDRIPA
jgi:hypothetical protein